MTGGLCSVLCVRPDREVHRYVGGVFACALVSSACAALSCATCRSLKLRDSIACAASENSVTKGALEQGRRLAAVLAGSWRPVPPHADFAVEDWDATVARLLETGAGGLGWWRVRESELRHLPASAKLHDAYRMHSLEAGMHEPSIAEAFDRCRRAGVEPLLAKGWAVARMYPEPGLRPFGDIDLFVRPEQHLTAQTALAGLTPRRLLLDLQRGFPDLADHPLQEVFAHSRISECNGIQVRTVGPEDQLRHLCVHLLRHGAWRPLWLCDVAAAVESADVNFDWDYCLRGRRQRTAGCRLRRRTRASTPRRAYRAHAAGRSRPTPSALARAGGVASVGQRYERFTTSRWRRRCGTRPRSCRRFGGAGRILSKPRCSFAVHSTTVPRLPFQLADCLVRLGGFLLRLPRDLVPRSAWSRD